MMNWFGKPKARLYAVIDVGSHSLKALVFSASEGGASLKVSKKLVLNLPVSLGRLEAIEKLREFMFALVKELGRVPAGIIIALGPPLVEVSLERWNARPPKDTLSRKELTLLFQNLSEEHRASSGEALAYPVGIFVNGYPASPAAVEKSPVHTISFSTVLLRFPHEVGTMLSELKKSLGGLPIEFIPLVWAEHKAVSGALRLQDALLIDMGGEETTLLFLKESRMAGIASFPIGGRVFLKQLASSLSVSLKEAEDLKRQHVQGLLAPGLEVKVKEALAKEAEKWKQNFLGALDSFYPYGPLPPQVLLTGGGADFPNLGVTIRSDWLKDFSYVASPQVRVFDAASIFGGSTLGGFLRGPGEAGLASLVFYSLEHEAVL